MNRFGKGIILLIISAFLLSSCLSGIWTGATLFYDRHNVYKKLSDYKLMTTASQALYKDNTFKQEEVRVELAVFNGDVLLVGDVPTEKFRKDAYDRVAAIKGYRRLFNQLSVISKSPNGLQDSWITGEIRSQMLADSSIDPAKFKVVTFNQIVYLMGDVVPEQARLVITIARQCNDVKRVVKLFKYYNLSDKADN